MSRYRPSADAWVQGRWLPKEFVNAMRRCNVSLSADVLWVRIARQELWHSRPELWRCGFHNHWCLMDDPLARRYVCSTSKFGIGQRAGSNRTPLGLHRIAQKIGGGWPVGTVFKGRKPAGFTWRGLPLAPITTRILWLEGLEPGFNRGGKVDSFARYIYIHGTSEELTLGRPASHGCIHLGANDLMPLFDKLPVGTLVWISEQ